MKKTKWIKKIAVAIKYILFAFSIAIMLITIISVFNSERKTVLGYSFFTVLSDSMKAEFKSGDIILSKKVDTDSLKNGDIISFKSIDPREYGEIITHKIREKTVYEGKTAFITYGTTTGANDSVPALSEEIIGVYCGKIPKAGYFINFLRSPAGYFSLIFFPFFALILIEGIRFMGIINTYKKEEKEKIELQNKKLEAEHLKTEKMAEEIELLKTLLEKQMTVIEKETNSDKV